jgi:orotate phosphoribosyltransferase
MLRGALTLDKSQSAINGYRTKLAQILKEKSVFVGDFVLASGQRSNYYLDTRLTTLSPDGISIVSYLIWALIQPIINEIHGVAGPSIGADPIVTGVCQLSYLAGHPIKAGYIRKESKNYGRTRLIEGPIERGENIIVLEDVITTGTSSLKAVNALKEHGCNVDHLICLVLREELGKNLLEREVGLTVHSIFHSNDLLNEKS